MDNAEKLILLRLLDKELNKVKQDVANLKQELSNQKKYVKTLSDGSTKVVYDFEIDKYGDRTNLEEIKAIE